jgi:hypothetical protein
VGPHHSEGLLDAQLQCLAHPLGDMATKGTQTAGRELPAWASPSSTARQVSRAASRSSRSSCSEEL